MRRKPAETTRHLDNAQGTDWLGASRTETAAARILDVAGDLFVTHGVAAVNMNQIAAVAGCSRATLYRYFASRSDLLLAYVERGARALSAEVAVRIADIDDVGERITEAILTSVEGVRADPVMHSWFSPEAAGLAGAMGAESALVNQSAVEMLAGQTSSSEAEVALQARFIVRIVISLLTTPGADAAEERQIVERFVTPVIVNQH